MAGLIEDYALIGDMQTAALVGKDGSIDWLCLPRFDSPACFTRLLGTDDHGHWSICPAGQPGDAEVARHYQGDTLILQTEWRTATGTVRLIDFMPPRDGKPPVLVRIVEGVHGHVDMECTLRMRLGYGAILPWVRRQDGRICAVAGPDSLWLDTPVTLTGRNMAHHASFRVTAGKHVPFVLTWRPSHEGEPERADPAAELSLTTRFWRDWAFRCTYEGPHREAVVRSLITLKALTYAPTGGIVAAATTSLPEDIGGVRNWDYRYCWLRDATITLEALLRTGYTEEAAAWRAWLERAIAGDPKDVQIMYSVTGERRLAEWEAEWLPGYENSAPVRIGNAAVGQRQLDVYGEVIDALSMGRAAGHQLRPARLVAAAGAARLPGEELGPARRGHLGGARAEAALRALQGDGLGRLRPRLRGRQPRACRARAITGARSPTRSTKRCAPMGTTSSVARSPSTTGRRSWTPPSCSSPRSASCPRTTRGWCPPWRRSPGNWSPTAWSAATSSPPANRRSMAWPAARARFSPAASGW